MLDGEETLDESRNVPWIIQNLNAAHTSDLIIAFIYFEALKLGKQFETIEFVFIVTHSK